MMTPDTSHDHAAIAHFLEEHGWPDAVLTPLAGDASTRAYMRVRKAGKRGVLMIAPPSAEAPSCPVDASNKHRRTLGYNASARLAGPNLSAFIQIAQTLKNAGLSAPEIFAADTKSGFVLLEDLGDDLFARIVGEIDETQLYEAAVDVLIALHEKRPDAPYTDQFAMLRYDDLALETEAHLLLEWYWPLKKEALADQDCLAEFSDALSAMLKALSAPMVMTLRDYHAENLLWLPQREGVKKVGLIDFQDGLIGSPAYDLVSLLEDARRDVSPALGDQMIKRYCERIETGTDYSKDQFETDYAILAAQRNAKILGIFARLAKRDGKPRYLDLLPRVEAHFRRDLARPQCAPLKAFFEKYLPEIAP